MVIGLDEFSVVAEKFLNKPTFVRKRDGTYKFGILKQVNWDNIIISFFAGGECRIFYADISEIRPFIDGEGKYVKEGDHA